MSAQGIRLSTSAKADTSHELVTRIDRLPVDSMNNDIARGKVPNAYPFSSFGQRTFTGSAEGAVVWTDGDFPGPLAGGAQLSVVSTSTNDSANGTGIRTVEIHYLDTNLAEKVEVITLNGTTPVLTQAADIHFINVFHVVTFGSLKKADGAISVSYGGSNYANIRAGENVQFSSVRMVPAGKVFYLAGAVAGSSSLNSDSRVTVKLASNLYNGLTFSNPFILLPHGLVDLQDNTVTFNFPVASAYHAGSVIALIATVDKACQVSGSLYGWMEDA
jgi:hypothetical protein